MTLLHPALFAAGAACIAIPIIIHLLMHRRRKPVMWGAMRFLVEAYKRQRRKLMVEKWLLLAARCLLLLLLAAAVGRPLMEKLGASAGGRTIYLLIDNGIGSSARDVAGAASGLERHKAAARAILDAVRAAGGGAAESDRVGLVALGNPAEGVVVPASANLGSIEGLIDALEPTDSRTDIPGAMALVAGAIGGQGEGDPNRGASTPERTFVVVLSDFTEGAADLTPGGENSAGAAQLPDGVRVLATEPALNALSNVAITGLEPLRSVLIDAARAGVGGGSASTSEASDLVRVLLRRTGEGVSQSGLTTLRARLAPAEAGAAADAPGASGGSSAEQTVVRWSPGQESAVAVAPVRADRKMLSAARGNAGGAGAASDVVLIASIDDDAIAGDNRWRRPIEVRESLRVGVVAPIRFGKAERVDKLDPGTWARLALQPAGEGTGIDVTDIEPASLDQARLNGLDAVLIARPDLVSEASWARVRLFVESGGLAMVMPPPSAPPPTPTAAAGSDATGGGTTTHIWGDAMSRGLGVEWMPAREAKVVEGSRLVRGAGVAGGTGRKGDGADVLSLVEGELDELLGAVHVSRVLPLVPAPEGGETLLRMEDGTAVLWVGETAKSQMANGHGMHKSMDGGRGMVVYLGVGLDLEWSDLPAKPLMVPLMQELVRQGVGRARGSWQSIAGSVPAVPARTAELRRLADPARVGSGGKGAERAPAGDTRFRVQGAGAAGSGDPVRRAGLYRALDDRGASRGIVAVNADARGSRTGVQTRDAVDAWLHRSVGGAAADGEEGGKAAPGLERAITWIPGGSGAGSVPAGGGGGTPDLATAVAGVLGKSDRGSPISLPLLIGALAIALLEVLLARRASHAEAHVDVPGPGVQNSAAPVDDGADARTGVAA